MDEVENAGWPYRFCDACKKLSPVEPLTADISRCMICNDIIDEQTGGRTVYLSIQEARVRDLEVI